MSKCVICDIITNPTFLEDTIIYETDLFIVKAAKGMVVPGHLLLIPKKHINGIAEMSMNQIETIYSFSINLVEKIKSSMNCDVILYEHGSIPEGRHKNSIVHAHLHIIPYNLSTTSTNRIIRECKMKRIYDYRQIEEVKNKDYSFFRDGRGNMYLSHSIDFPRSLIFRVIAIQEGLESNYEWRDEKNNREDYLKRTIKMGKLLLDKK